MMGSRLATWWSRAWRSIAGITVLALIGVAVATGNAAAGLSSLIITIVALFADAVLAGRERQGLPERMADPSRLVRVRVFHNLVASGYGDDTYQDGHAVSEVFRTFVRASGSDEEICEQVFVLLNVGHDPEFTDPVDARAVDYRERGNRSLSVADVIALDGEFYAVDRTGFQPIATPYIVVG